MPRYIDADLLRCVVLACSDRQGGFDADEILTMIDAVKPTDVEEVRQGEWEEVNGVFFCTRCGDSSTSMTAYCCNCGAEMRLKRKESGDGRTDTD